MNAQRQCQGQVPRPRPDSLRPRPRTDSPRSRPKRTDSPRPRPRTWNPRRRPRTDSPRPRPGLAVQSQDQGLETQDQGHGQLASRILEAKAVSSRTPFLMCIKGYRVKYTAYSTVHYLILDKKNYDWRIGGSQDPQEPLPLGYAHETERTETT